MRITLQLGTDFNSLLNLIWILVVVAGLYWLFSLLRRIDKTLQEIKKKLDTITNQSGTTEGNNP